MATELTRGAARTLLDYDQDTGEFIRKYPPSRRNKNGRLVKVGWPDNRGYIIIRLGRKCYKAHRLAWLWEQIDHIDRNKSNNKWSNLREATNSQNQANTAPRRNNTAGLKGAHKHPSGWTSRIRVNGERHFLGIFDSPEKANAAYRDAAARLHGEFGRA